MINSYISQYLATVNQHAVETQSIDNKGTCGDTEAVQRSYFLSGVVGVARCNSRSVIRLAAIIEFFSVIIFNVIMYCIKNRLLQQECIVM